MSQLLKSISLAALMALAGPAFAQDAATTAETPDRDAGATEAEAAPTETDTEGGENAPDSGEAGSETETETGLAMGEEVGQGSQIGQSYVAETFEDWEQRCIRAEDGNDPCQLYQLLRDEKGNAVAEMSIFALPEGGQAAAGSTIITPLETLLTRQLTLAVDSAPAKRYPFEFCAEAGCFSRVGFTEAEVLAFKRGSEATLSIVPAAAPDQTIDLTISLAGFTAGYEATKAANEN